MFDPGPCAEEPFSGPGKGLFIALVRVVVDVVGVLCADALGECVLPASVVLEDPEGEAVPEVLSFLLFDLLLSRLARESWSC